MRLAVIPARGGSRRIPRKNIRDFCGRPIMAWSIDAAYASKCFDRIIVSTDDYEIAKIAEGLGAQVPFMRPAELSNDYTGTIPVIAHAISALIKEGDDPQQVCCIYATAPFIQAADIRRGLELLEGEDCKYTFSVTRYPFPIQRAIQLTPTGSVRMFNPEHFNTRSQDLVESYHDAGQFYWGTAEAWLTGRNIFGDGSLPVVLPRYRVQDIDTLEDWKMAELMFQTAKRQQKL